MNIKKQIASELKPVLKELTGQDIEPNVTFNEDSSRGDYSTNVAMIAFGKGKGERGKGKGVSSPVELAEEIKQQLTINNSQLTLFDRVEVVKPGFINFSLTSEFLVQKLQNSDFESLKSSNREKKGKVVVEYSSPNIAKPFTIGHLRSTIIGDAVANLLEAVGYEVYRDSHVGDWGTQFGKQIYAIKEWGNQAEIASSERPVKLLVDLYVKFHSEAEKNPELEEKARAWFKKLEDGDPEARALWEKCIDWSWREFDAIYRELGVPSGDGAQFENNGRGFGESFFEDKMEPVIKELEDKGLLKVGKEGAKIVEFEESVKFPPLMILKKDGATLYSTRDLATDKYRIEKYGKDVLIINEVGMEQSLYFQQLYALEQKLGWFKSDQRVHLKHGLIRFKEGKMSTRKGNTIWLEDVLEEAKERARKLGEVSRVSKVSEVSREEVMDKLMDENISSDLAKIVAIGAIKWNDLKRDSKQDIMFDWDDVLNMQGNSGPYIQYVFARTQSVLERGKREALSVKDFTLYPLPFTLEAEERELLRLLNKFDEVVEDAAERLAPNIVCTYLFELSQAFNLFYQKCPIIKSENDIREFRLFLTSKTGWVIQYSLNLLGIQTPSKM